MSASEICGVSYRHTERLSSPVSVVWQCKLVSDRELKKRIQNRFIGLMAWEELFYIDAFCYSEKVCLLVQESWCRTATQRNNLPSRRNVDLGMNDCYALRTRSHQRSQISTRNSAVPCQYLSIKNLIKFSLVIFFYARKQNASRVLAIVWASVRPSVRPSVCLSVRHTRDLYQNGAS